jgi:hypothetical protein
MNSYNTNVFPQLSIKVISMGTILFPSMVRLALLKMNKQKMDPETPPTTHLNVRWRKRIRGKK